MYRTNLRVSQATKARYEQMGGVSALRTLLDARMGAPGAFDGVLELILRVRDEGLRETLIVFAQEAFSLSHDSLMAKLDERLNLS